MAEVNLDALIAREDFEVEDNINSGKKKEAISISEFEKFIIEYDYLIQQINWKYRSAQKSYSYISMFLQKVVSTLKTGKSINDSINEIISTPEFNYLTLQKMLQQIDSLAKDFKYGKKERSVH